MKGIILAGGSGTRLFPSTLCISKQLLPVYDKPMIYYPLSMLMLSGIKEILIISSPLDIPRIQMLFGSGDDLGLQISYAVQKEPRGIADAFLVGKDFIGKDPVCLVLGDNILHGHNLQNILRTSASLQEGAIIFGYKVSDPSRYGVVTFNKHNEPIGIEEKPKNPLSSYAVPGIYFYDANVVSVAESLKPSARGELEITDINKTYLENKRLKVTLLGRGVAWLDAGTHDALHKASSFVQTLQERQGVQIACVEEIAFRMGNISKEKLLLLSKKYPNSYGQYLVNISSD